ncbi:MAG: LuxR C-terminal-related transcriptional regulator [Nocardioides marinisabuli]|uniref:winged helix-turn-helix transcriptional regulator n=1 Tax=Nocardioides marinisabuli TaxID=419476 RepID=UPI00321BC039
MTGSGSPGSRAPWAPDETDVRILGALARGQTLRAVARSVGLSERTVRRRLRATAEEIGVESTIEAVVHAVRSGVI